MSRRLSSRRNSMKGGAWFNYPDAGEDFDITDCNEEKISSALLPDYTFMNRHLKKSDVELSEKKKKNTVTFNNYKNNKNGDKGLDDSIYIPLMKDNYNIYEGRKIFHKYYGEGVIEGYKEYSLRNRGYGYYVRFIDPDLKPYVYTFASPRFSKNILIESYSVEIVLDMFLRYKGSKKKKKHGKLLNDVLQDFSVNQDQLKKIKENDNYFREFKTKCNKMAGAYETFFDIKGKKSFDIEEILDPIEELNSQHQSPEKYIQEWEKTYLAIDDLKKSSMNFHKDEAAAKRAAALAAADDKETQRILLHLWRKYKPNSYVTPSPTGLQIEDRKNTGQLALTRGGNAGGALLGGILLLLGLPFIIIGTVARVVFNVVVFTIGIAIAAASIILMIPFAIIGAIFGGGGRGNYKTKARRLKSRRNRSRRKTNRRNRY